MSASETHKRNKLIKVSTFYRNQADNLAEQCRQLNTQISELRRQEQKIEGETDYQQRHFAALPPTTTRRMLAHQCLQQLASRKQQNQVQMRSALKEFELNRAALLNLMAKIESIEKLVQGLTEAITLGVRKQEQVNADERYLNTHFNNKPLT